MYPSSRFLPRALSLLFTWLLAGYVLGSARPAAAKVKGGYIDLLLAEAVGDLGAQQYDVYRTRDGNDVFVGTLPLDRRQGTLLAAGFGLRLSFAMENGLRFSGEVSVQGGRLIGSTDPLLLTSTMTRAEAMAGFGYQATIGPVVLHTIGLLGSDYSSLKATLAPAPTAIQGSAASGFASRPPAPPPAPEEDLTLQRWGLRLGVQVGAHVQVAKLAALYADATLDYDGQWRARCGIAIGEPGRRLR